MTRIIDAEALKKALINAHINMVLTFDISTFNCVMNTIDNAPTVELLIARGTNGVVIPMTRPTGKWIDHGYTQYGLHIYECSLCATRLFVDDFGKGFCGNCGARMEVEE